jgi:6-phosphogluconolactonase
MRTAIFSTLILCMLVLPSTQCAVARDYFVYIGTFTDKDAKGIYVARMHNGEISPVELAAETLSPSFLAIHPNKKFLYAVNEISTFKGEKAGAVSAFVIDPHSGKLTFLNQVSARGDGPCHLIVDKTGRNVLVANYGGGSVTVLPIKPNGQLGDATAFIQHKGSSANADRQSGPHAHCVLLSKNNRFAAVADLGLDHVEVYRFDAAKGSLTPANPPFTKVDPGAGPRHLALHPGARFAYVINEMTSSVTAFHHDEATGAFSSFQTLSTLPPDFHGQNSGAELEVHPSGKFLYGSNRGHDSIASFDINPGSGALTATGQTPTQGHTPRGFGIDPVGQYLLAANQNSNTVVVFKIDAATGHLTPTGKVLQVPTPVCVKFVPAK